jgi:hypothetical protein
MAFTLAMFLVLVPYPLSKPITHESNMVIMTQLFSTYKWSGLVKTGLGPPPSVLSRQDQSPDRRSGLQVGHDHGPDRLQTRPKTGPETGLGPDRRISTHNHILIRYENDIPLHEIDNIVSAEVPDNIYDAELVRDSMMHHHQANGVLGDYCDPKRTGKCRFGFPKPLLAETVITSDGRVHYRRRRPCDQWVVAYNLAFLRAFRAHINFEFASASQLFQYLFKYVSKSKSTIVSWPSHFLTYWTTGADYTQWLLHAPSDGPRPTFNEFDHYQTSRYLSAGEAAWRILGNSVTSITPSVTGLPVHTPSSTRHHQYHRKDGRHSTLSLLDRYFLRPLGFFERDGAARSFDDIKYLDYYGIFYHEAINPTKPRPAYAYQTCPGPDGVTQWARAREVQNVHHARMHGVKPTAGEAFYIRHLLDLQAARTWEDLRTVDGVVHATFQEAAIATGMFSDQNEAELAMEEAADTQLALPSQLRSLFSHLLLNDCCEAPLMLWNRFYERMSADFFWGVCQEDMPAALDRALDVLAGYLEEGGKQLRDFGLPQPRAFTREVNEEHEQFGTGCDRLAAQAAEAYDALNSDQRKIFDTVTSAIQAGEPLAFFIMGGAGTGKTFLVNALCNWVRGRGDIAIPTATSASAATLYTGGRTTHSAFKVT